MRILDQKFKRDFVKSKKNAPLFSNIGNGHVVTNRTRILHFSSNGSHEKFSDIYNGDAEVKNVLQEELIKLDKEYTNKKRIN